MPKKLTTEEFIAKAKAIHGDKYDYSSSNYENSMTKLIIICKEHGEFLVTPNGHLSQKHGCRVCARNKPMNTVEFISRAIGIHGDLYDYSDVKYSGSHNVVKIICKKHGAFEQVAYSHLAGRGCKKCKYEEQSILQTNDLSEFIKKSLVKHGGRYAYDKTLYLGAHVKVQIKCPVHGYFWQKPNSHLNGRGCPSCAKNGFDRNKIGFIYFLHGPGVIKVGITNDIKRRVVELKRATPFVFDVIKFVTIHGLKAERLERYFHNKYKKSGLTGFDGATEWLVYSSELMNEIINL